MEPIEFELPERYIQIQRKMDPYEFWNKIGAPKKVVAPMVDNSDLPYRLQTRKYGAELVYTQMFNCNIFSQSKECRRMLFTTCPEDRPLFCQFAGHDPEKMLQSAKYVENECDAVDINLGCPQGIAKRGRYGAFLMEELDLLYDIVSTMVKGLNVPVTCKTRIYKDFNQTIRLLETLYRAGASVLTIHGRTRDEKGQFIREPDWNTIARIKEYFKAKEIPIPIIANGGIENIDDLNRCLEVTKADAVMTSEAILENPAIFTSSIDPKTQTFRTQLDLAEEYLDYVEKYPVWHMKIVRSHVMKMLYRYIINHNQIRNRLGKTKSLQDYRDLCTQCREIIEENGGMDQEKYSFSWYLRYRSPNKPCDPEDEVEEEEEETDAGVFEEDCDECVFDALGMFS